MHIIYIYIIYTNIHIFSYVDNYFHSKTLSSHEVNKDPPCAVAGLGGISLRGGVRGEQCQHGAKAWC